MSVCRSCHGQIIWARTVNGRPMPVDAEPAANGNVILVATQRYQAQPPTAKVLGREEAAEHAGALYVSHFASCPQRTAWRRQRLAAQQTSAQS